MDILTITDRSAVLESLVSPWLEDDTWGGALALCKGRQNESQFNMPRKIVFSIWILGTLVLPFCISSTDKLDAAMLKGLEIPKECKAIDGRYATDLQTLLLYQRYDLYKSLLPRLAGKQAQSFKCGSQKGTAYYFEYASVTDRAEAEVGIRRLLWGEDHSTPEHPEQIETVENVLLVVAFDKAPNALLAAIRAKLVKVLTPTEHPNSG